jgi:HEAT repeat protein
VRSCCLAVLVGFLSVAASAGGAPAPAAKGKPLAVSVLDKLRGQLDGQDDPPALQAAKELGDSGSPNAAEPLIATLAAGTTPARAQAALAALGRLNAPRSVDVLVLYAGHRNNELRTQACKALAGLNDKRATTTLLDRLGDAAPEVRAAAAEGLAARHERQATPRLFLLVKRNDPGAAAPLGSLATPDLIPQLAELQGGIDDAVLATALGEYLKRDDVSDKLRVEVVKTIGKISGAAATTALIEYTATVSPREDRPSRREAQKVIDERGNGR